MKSYPKLATFLGAMLLITACEVEKTGEGELPKVSVDGGQLPKYEIEKTQEGRLPDVDVDAIAGRIIRERFLRGIPRLRFWAPDVSSILRYDRAEGLVTGAGLAFGILLANGATPYLDRLLVMEGRRRA